MKKNSKKVLALVMTAAMALGLAACSSSGQKAPETTTGAPEQTTAAAAGTEGEKTAGQPVQLTFATQDVGTTSYVYASTMANLFTDVFPKGSIIDVTTTSPGGVGAPVILENGQCNIIISNGAPTKWACDTGILGNPPAEKVRAIAGGLDTAFINILFTKEFVDKTGIKTVEELVEKKYPVHIAIKSQGAFGELACEKVFEVLGVSYDDIKSWGGSVTNTGTDAIVSLLKDGKADMTIDHIAPGQSATTELCMTADMYFPQLSDDTLAKLREEGFSDSVIEANTWNGQTESIKSVGSPQVVLVSADMDDETAYTLTKAICEGKEALVNASAALKAFDPQKAWEPSLLGAPIHPGAEAYYKDAGYMK